VLSDLQLLRQVSSLFAVVVTIAVLSMAGLPPTLGFFAKYYYYEVLIECGMTELCIVLILLNGFSLYYYINILKNIWLSVDYDAVNTIYIPLFRWEAFMVFTTFIFCLLNIFAIFVHKHLLFLVSKLSLIGSRVVFAQIYVYLMKYPLTKYLYLKSLHLSTEPHLEQHLSKFITSKGDLDSIFVNPEIPTNVIGNSYFERDLIVDNIIHRNVFPSLRSAFENFSSDSE
jgi:NADH:ubiquinone oxidoreductase subunit 5 (subunit L)/multisubunit Na+/H+ antiporter MnhA subunit